MRVLLSGMVTSLLLLAGLAAAQALARRGGPASADEECVMQCDEESDKCMRQAGQDEEKAKACDDKYAECLKKCR